jgi:hypothetical protein
MLFRFLLLIFIPSVMFSLVELKAPETFLQGEPVNFSISASGSNVDFPDIKSIDSYTIQQTGTSTQISIINGLKSQKIIKSFRFYPASSVILPSFKIKVDGKIQQTKEHKITLQKIKKTKSDIFDLTIDVDKTQAYVGEEIYLTMRFKYKKDIQIYDLQFSKPIFNNFWSKQLQTPKLQQDNLYVVQELKYLLFAQKSGTLNIPPFKIVAVLPDRNSFGFNSFFQSATINKKIYSNSLKLDIKPLPKNIYLVGDFKIKAIVDKTTIKAAQAVSYQLEISGRGNIDDLQEYNLNIPQATIYDNPSQKSFNIKNGKYGGIYKKTYSIVANEDFVIPAIQLKYLDKKTNKIKTISTKEYKIKVLKSTTQTPKIETKNTIKQKEIIKEKIIYVNTELYKLVLSFIGGFIIASLIFALVLFKNTKNNNKKDLLLLKSIKKSTSSSELLKKITPFVNIDTNLDKIIYTLEDNNFENLKSIKKEIIKILKRLKL